MPDGLRARAAAGQMSALIVLLLLAVAARRQLPVGAFYPFKCAACFVVIAVVVIALVDRETHPFQFFGAANHVTTVRAVLVALVLGAIGEPASTAVAGSAVAAGMAATLLDGIDGWLARHTQIASRFGARFDMEVDALLILALAILAWQHGKAGAWVVLSGLLRYVFVAAGWMFPQMRRPLPESRRRQTICVVQIGGLLIALAPFVTPPASEAVAATALLALIYSFVVDTVWLLRA